MFPLAAAFIAAAVALAHPQPNVLFSVLEGSDGLAIEPIAMVTKTPGTCAGCWKLTFAEPPDTDEFRTRYYRPGRTYHVLVGGAEVGTARVTKEASLGCVSLAASVDVTPPLPKESPIGLAVGSLRIAPRKQDLYEETDAEEKAFRSLAEKAFRARGVPATLFKDMEGSFLSTDLNGDGKRDLIGSFEAYDHKATDSRDYHRLFLIAMADDAGGYHTEYVWYHLLGKGKSENSTETLQLFDTIDLDEDGTDEVIVRNSFYESYEYEILKRAPSGKWTIVYKGGGSGC
ncbi:MAG TPA: hypothetical protein VGA84_03285 [Thermoanaerobaculia bacterium]